MYVHHLLHGNTHHSGTFNPNNNKRLFKENEGFRKYCDGIDYAGDLNMPLLIKLIHNIISDIGDGLSHTGTAVWLAVGLSLMV